VAEFCVVLTAHLPSSLHRYSFPCLFLFSYAAPRRRDGCRFAGVRRLQQQHPERVPDRGKFSRFYACFAIENERPIPVDLALLSFAAYNGPTELNRILTLAFGSISLPILLLQYEFAAETIESSANLKLASAVDASDGLGQTVSASAFASDSQWPYVTFFNYELSARQWIRTSGADFMGFVPLVPRQVLPQWDGYSVDNQGWINRSFQIEGEDRPSTDPIPSNVYRFEDIDGALVTVGESSTEGQYQTIAPVWEMSPPPANASAVNYNALSASWFQAPYETMMQLNSTGLGDATAAVALLDLTLEDENDGDSKEPYSMLATPIYNSTSAATGVAEPVGLIWTIVRWDKYLDGYLPTDIDGILCVLKNSCTDVSYTYEVYGKEAAFVGEGDLHDQEYDIYEYSFELTPSSGEQGESAGDATRCVYTFYTYPTSDFVSLFSTSSSISAAAAMAAVFIVLVLSFLLYDHLIKKKNNKVVDIAARSNGILTTLFPEDVRNKLLAEQDARNNGDNMDEKMKSMLKGGDDVSESEVEEDAIFRTKPIANLFTDTTILVSPLCLLHDLESHSTSSHLLTSKLSHLLHPSTNLPI